VVGHAWSHSYVSRWEQTTGTCDVITLLSQPESMDEVALPPTLQCHPLRYSRMLVVETMAVLPGMITTAEK